MTIKEDRNGIIRGENGRFVPGQSGNPAGRPKRAVEKERLDSLNEELTDKDWREIVGVAIARAKAGDAAARNWLSSYSAGQPTERLAISHDGDDMLGDLSDDQIAAILSDHTNGNGTAESTHAADVE